MSFEHPRTDNSEYHRVRATAIVLMGLVVAIMLGFGAAAIWVLM